MRRIIRVTEDGSSTVYIPEWDESYHSSFGSIQESKHVFIQAGLEKVRQSGKITVSILEVGFGTGLNAWLTALYAAQLELAVNYVAIEPFPLEKEIFASLNYPEISDIPGQRDLFIRLHESPNQQEIRLLPGFSLLKLPLKLEEYIPETRFDLVYYDAFAPRVQPEMWTEEIFKKMYDLLLPGGILVTYCAKGAVKRHMRSAGFFVESLPGPKGKREMTRAVK